MANTYRTTRNAPVYRKPGGSAQARIGENVSIAVEEWSGNYARFSSPVVLESEPNRQWISAGDIVPVGSPPPEEPPPVESPTTLAGTLLIVLPDGSQLHNRDDIIWE